MARERIIVKEALNALKYLLNQLMKNNNDFDVSLDKMVLNSNLFSFAVRFLRDIGKISGIVSELVSKLSQIGSHLIRNLNMMIYDREGDSADDLYCKLYEFHVYPIARILEALGGSNAISGTSSNYGDINGFVNKAIDTMLNYFAQEDMMIYLFDTNQKFVPIVQGILGSLDTITERDVRNNVYSTLLKIRDLALTNDPDMKSIATQDIFYLIKLRSGKFLENDEMKPLFLDLKSRVFKRVLKGIEYLTMFGIEPPQGSIDYILALMPKFFSEIFRVGNSNSTFIYYSSIAESMHNILNHYNNKAFAQAMMNYLIEDTGWIARNNYSYVDFVKTVIGTSLLIQARGAIRR